MVHDIFNPGLHDVSALISQRFLITIGKEENDDRKMQ